MVYPIVKEIFPLYNWHNIWKNIQSKFVEPYQRGFLYRYINETLPTNERLYMLGIKSEEKCSKCEAVENQLHIIYFCKYVKNVVSWFERILRTIGGNKNNMIKVLMFDIDGKNKREINTITMMVADYIQSMWICRRDNVDPQNMIDIIKTRMKANRCMLIKAYDISKSFTDEYIK